MKKLVASLGIAMIGLTAHAGPRLEPATVSTQVEVLILPAPAPGPRTDSSAGHAASKAPGLSYPELVSAIVGRLERFKPDVLAIAWQSEDPAALGGAYEAFLKGERTPGSTIAEQIGFRLARSAQIRTLIPLEPGAMAEDERAQFYPDESPVVSVAALLHVAERATRTRQHPVPGRPAGPEELNLLRLLQGTNPGDRLLVICPLSRARALRDAIVHSGRFQVVPLAEFLDVAAASGSRDAR